MTDGEGKATDPLTGQVGHLLEGTKAGDALPHDIALVPELTPGCHRIEGLPGHEVARPLTTAAAREHLPSKHEATAKAPTAADGHHLEDSPRGETIEPDRLLLHGDLGLLTARESRAMLHGVGVAHVVPGTLLRRVKTCEQPGEVLLQSPVVIGMVARCLQEAPNRRQTARGAPLGPCAENRFPT